jgi:hypothetical protein
MDTRVHEKRKIKCAAHFELLHEFYIRAFRQLGEFSRCGSLSNWFSEDIENLVFGGAIF